MSMAWVGVGSAVIGAGASIYGSNQASKTAGAAQQTNTNNLSLGLQQSEDQLGRGIKYIKPYSAMGTSALQRFGDASVNNQYLGAQGVVADRYARMNPYINYPEYGSGQFGLGQLPSTQVGNQFNAGQVGVTQEDIMNDPSFNLMKDMGLENSAQRASAMGMRNSSARMGVDNAAIRDATLATRDRIGQDQMFNAGQDWQGQLANYGRATDIYGNQMNQAGLQYQNQVDNWSRAGQLAEQQYNASLGNYGRRASQYDTMFNQYGSMGGTQMGLLGGLTDMGYNASNTIFNAYNNLGANQMGLLGSGMTNTTNLANNLATNQAGTWSNVGTNLQSGITGAAGMYNDQQMLNQYLASRQPMNQPNVGPQWPGGS